MIKIDISKLCVFLLFVIGLFWFIPHFYIKTFKMDRYQLSGFFSPTLREFIVQETTPDKSSYKNENGAELNKIEAQKNLPFIFYGNIEKWKAFPLKTVDGKTISYEDASSGPQVLRVTPRDVSKSPLPLYVLFESEPIGVSLETPSDILSIKSDRIVFIDCADGEINEHKSKIFTDALKNAGVVFPILKAASNPSDLKPFDEGMFLADSDNKLFWLKMVKGKPSVIKAPNDIKDDILFLNVYENDRKLFQGSIATKDALYLQTYDNGFKKLPIESYNPKEASVFAIFTSMYQSVVLKSISNKNPSVRYIAADDDFNLVRLYEKTLPNEIERKKERIYQGLSFLTPFILTQFEASSNEVLFDLDFAPNYIFAILGIFFALILYIGGHFIFKKRLDFVNLAAICLTGIPGLMALLIFRTISKKFKEQK